MLAEKQKELKSIGYRVSARRSMLGMSQAELAFQCGLSTNAIHSIEAGKSEARASTLKALSIVLSCSPEYFLFGDSFSKESNSGSQIMDMVQRAQSRLDSKKLDAFIKQSQCLIETLAAL